MSVMTPQAEAVHRFRAMASPVTVRIIDPVDDAAAATREVESIFQDIERSCSRFASDSDLTRANAQPGEWTAVAPSCFEAIELAYAAYTRTGGAFDPRVLRTLAAMGYDRSLDFTSGDVRTEAAELPQSWAVQAWRPEFDAAGSRVRLGSDPIDLGGIGKGYAVRRGIEAVAGLGSSALVEAGGDLATYGDGPARAAGEIRAWRAAVEDPRGDAIGADRQGRPIAILDASDAAVATSSISLRRWRSGDRAVHHLIDPRTGQPAASGLLSVTVVDDDPAWAEVWTKAAFLQGAEGIAAFVDDAGVAALWVDEAGALSHSAALSGRVIWEAPDAR
jgi:thiamine biosynthesis lipoprotein